MRDPKIAVACLVVALLGGTAAFPAGTIAAADIQSLSSAVAARTPPATVSAQFGDLLRRHAAAKLPIATVEGLLNQVLRDTAVQLGRDIESTLVAIERNNQAREALRSQIGDLRTKHSALVQLVNTTDSALAVTHGDRLLSAAELDLVAQQRLLDAISASIKEVRDALKLEFQQMSDRNKKAMEYLVQVVKAMNEVVRGNVSNFTL